MDNKKNKSGFIMMLSLMLIFLCMFLVLYIANKESIFVPYARIAVERKRAYILAQNGIQLALSQLVSPKAPTKDKGSSSKGSTEPTESGMGRGKSAEDNMKDMLTVVLPTLNRWQEVTLTPNADGDEGVIKFCIMCEQGKFNLNALYDFKNKKFVQPSRDVDMKKACKDIFAPIKSKGSKELSDAFEAELKKRDIRFNDATELLTRSFDVFKDAVFYEPPSEQGPKERPIYVMDLFTVWTKGTLINPWLMSDSVAGVFGFKRADAADIAERKKGVAQWLKQFKLKTQWQSDWDKLMKPMYGKEYNTIPKSLQPFLNSTFEATVFSVLSYATVGRVTQRLFAVVEIKPSVGDKPAEITIKKVYTL
jgi:hypothetical protein